MAHPAQQPPQAGSNGAAGVVIGDHLDTGPTPNRKKSDELRGPRQGMAAGRRRPRRGQVVVEVRIVRAGNMPGPVGGLTRVWPTQIEATIHHNPTRMPKTRGQLRR